MKRPLSDVRLAGLLLLLLCLAGGGCTKNEFVVKGEFPESETVSCHIRYYASDKRQGLIMDLHAVTEKGKFELRCPERFPALVFLYSWGDVPSAVFYAERGDEITVSGENSDATGWKITGNAITDALTGWRLDNLDALRGRNREAVDKAVEKYVKAHKDDEVSALLLLLYYSRKEDEPGFRRLWNSLGEEARSEKVVNLVARADVKTPDKLEGAPLRDIVLRTAGNGVDTLRPASAKATLLFFFFNSDRMNGAAVFDSLRAVAREWPDSTKRIIADVSFDTDSAGWRMPLRGDSLKGVVRGWAPRGFTEEWIMEQGVGSTPWFIVAGRKGKVEYSGSDPEKAFGAFRKSMK